MKSNTIAREWQSSVPLQNHLETWRKVQPTVLIWSTPLPKSKCSSTFLSHSTWSYLAGGQQLPPTRDFLMFRQVHKLRSTLSAIDITFALRRNIAHRILLWPIWLLFTLCSSAVKNPVTLERFPLTPAYFVSLLKNIHKVSFCGPQETTAVVFVKTTEKCLWARGNHKKIFSEPSWW